MGNLSQNYPGVEAHDMTEGELERHIEEGHMAAFDSHEKLEEVRWRGSGPEQIWLDSENSEQAKAIMILEKAG